jgi:hypothetical protein
MLARYLRFLCLFSLLCSAVFYYIQNSRQREASSELLATASGAPKPAATEGAGLTAPIQEPEVTVRTESPTQLPTQQRSVPEFWFSTPESPNECGEAVPFVDLQRKLVICTAPKAGSTALRSLLLHLRAECRNNTLCAAKLDQRKTQPKCKQELLRLSDLDRKQAEDVLSDPSFLRIAVVRNPLIRYLSAFLMLHGTPFFAKANFSQFVREEVVEQRDCSQESLLPGESIDHCFQNPSHHDRHGGKLTWEPSGWWDKEPPSNSTPPGHHTAASLSLPVQLHRRCPHYGSDLDNVVQHWYPQHCRCGFLQGVHYHLVGSFENFNDALETMLVQRGIISESFLSSGHGKDGNKPLFLESSGVKDKERVHVHRAVTNALAQFCSFYTNTGMFDAVAAAATDEIRILGYTKHTARLRAWLKAGCPGDAAPSHEPLATHAALAWWQNEFLVERPST